MELFCKHLRAYMLTGPMRQHIMEKVKKPLLNAIVSLASKYPPPTRENVQHPNSQILLDIRDKFFEHENCPCRDALFRAIWRMFIVEYEHDPYYQWRIDWVLDEIRKSDWLPKDPLPWEKEGQERRWRP